MPLRPSALIETLFNETRAMGAGRKATAESASDAMITVWNILEFVSCLRIVIEWCNKKLDLKTVNYSII